MDQRSQWFTILKNNSDNDITMILGIFKKKTKDKSQLEISTDVWISYFPLCEAIG